MPKSSTSRAIAPASPRARRTTRPPAGLYLTALSTSRRTACCSSPRSPLHGRESRARSSSRAMPLRSAAGRSDSTAAAVTSFRSRADSSRACPAFSCSMRLTSIRRVHHVDDAVAALHDDLHHVRQRRPSGRRGVDEELRVSLDHGERGAELVADVAQVLPPHPVQLLELPVGLDDAGQVRARLLEQPGVLQGHRGLVGKGLHQRLVLGPEPAHVLGEHLEGAQGLRPAPQGDPEEGAVAEALDHLGEQQARLLLHVQRDHRPPLLDHHPGQAVAQAEPLPRLHHLLLEPFLGRDLEANPRSAAAGRSARSASPG